MCWSIDGWGGGGKGVVTSRAVQLPFQIGAFRICSFFWWFFICAFSLWIPRCLTVGKGLTAPRHVTPPHGSSGQAAPRSLRELSPPHSSAEVSSTRGSVQEKTTVFTSLGLFLRCPFCLTFGVAYKEKFLNMQQAECMEKKDGKFNSVFLLDGPPFLNFCTEKI